MLQIAKLLTAWRYCETPPIGDLTHREDSILAAAAFRGSNWMCGVRRLVPVQA